MVGVLVCVGVFVSVGVDVGVLVRVGVFVGVKVIVDVGVAVAAPAVGVAVGAYCTCCGTNFGAGVLVTVGVIVDVGVLVGNSAPPPCCPARILFNVPGVAQVVMI